MSEPMSTDRFLPPDIGRQEPRQITPLTFIQLLGFGLLAWAATVLWFVL